MSRELVLKVVLVVVGLIFCAGVYPLLVAKHHRQRRVFLHKQCGEPQSMRDQNQVCLRYST